MPADQQSPRRKGGRPPKLSQTVADAVVKTVALGVPLRHAARAAGVAPQTVYNWMTRGRSERRGQYREFLDAIKKAEARAVVRRVRAIREAADSGTWQAAAWWLERRYPEDWSTHRREIRELMARLDALEHLAGKRRPHAREALAARGTRDGLPLSLPPAGDSRPRLPASSNGHV